jgi:hypothetical protein
MRGVAFLVLGLAACGQQPAQQKAEQRAAAPEATATAPQSKMYPTPAAARAAVLPVPEDKQQLARLLSLGYKVHEDHLHPPGMKECPFNMGGSVVQ